MKIINATTIGNLISAHMEGDEEKYAEEKGVTAYHISSFIE